MKIIGTANSRNENSVFSLSIVDKLDAIFTINVKVAFLQSADSYKKRIFTNGKVEKIFSKKEDSYLRVDFKLHEGDWLVISNEDGSFYMYISDLYCGPLKVRNRNVQEVIDANYSICRKRIDAKKEFAKHIGDVSRQLNLPFNIVLALKGDEELLKQLVENIQTAIDNRMYDDIEFMQALASEDNSQKYKAIKMMGIMNIPTFQYDKIARYIRVCLIKRRIIRRYE